MARNRFDYTFDSDLELKDTSAAITVSAPAEVGAAAKILDLGAGRVDGVIVIDAVAVDIAAGDEATVIAQVSNSATFAGGYFNAGCLIYGDVTLNGNDVDTVATAAAPNHQELHFTNDINGTVYRYLRLYTLIAASGSLTYTAFLAKAK